MLVQEERRIGRDVSCGRAGEIWYLTDDEGGCVERTQAVVVVSFQRGPQTAVCPASCWTWDGAGGSSLAGG